MTAVLQDLWRSARAWPVFAFYVLATLAVAAMIALITFDVIDLGMSHFGDPTHRTHDVIYGMLFTIAIAGVLAQLRRPERNGAAMVMALIPEGGLLLAGALSGDMDAVVRFNPLRYAAWVAAVAALLYPAWRVFSGSFHRSGVNVVMLALVGAAAVPLLALASTSIRLQRTVTDIHGFMGHYGFTAALCFTAVAVGILASLRPAGWRLTAWVAGLIPAVLGATSLLYPDSTSSLDPLWSVAAIAWGVAFVAVAALSGAPPSSAPFGFEGASSRMPSSSHA